MPKNQTKVIIKLPKQVSIDFVTANELKHYERFQWLALILTPIAAGFLTSFFTIPDSQKSLLFSAIIFSVISFLFIVLAFQSRKKIFNGKIEKKTSLDSFN